MTTATLDTHALSTTPLSTRLSRVIRLHLVSPMNFIGIPLIVIGIAWVISGAIFGILSVTVLGTTEDLRDGARNSWAVLSPLWYLISAGALAFAGTFPFALGMGSTRRDFHLGTSVLFVALAAAFSLLYTLLAAVERLTTGWGFNNWMFNSLWIGFDTMLVDFLGLFVLHLLVLFTGAAGATLWMRWRALGVIGFIVVCAGLLVGLLAAIGFSTGSWSGFFAWAGSVGLAGMFGLMFIPVVGLFLVSLVMIRFATPKD